MTPSFKKLPEVYKNVIKFNSDRGWHPTAHDTVSSVVIEAAELLELFQWKTGREKIDNKDPEVMHHLSQEIGDVMIYLFDLCELLNIDFIDAVEKKMQHNAEKYPVNQAKTDTHNEFYYSQKKKYREEKV